jgi:hypothetical protein
MKAMKYIVSLLLVSASLFFTACNDDEIESMSWRPGTGLHINVVGSGAFVTGATRSFYVDGFTTNENYEWRLNNNVIQPVRGGEFVSITFPSAGTYTLAVTNSKYSGTRTITVL